MQAECKRWKTIAAADANSNARHPSDQICVMAAIYLQTATSLNRL